MANFQGENICVEQFSQFAWIITTSYDHTHESVNDKQMVESPLRIERLYSICNTSHVNIHVTMSELVLGRR